MGKCKLLIFILLFLCFSCEKDPTFTYGQYVVIDDELVSLEDFPNVYTSQVIDITNTTAKGGGRIYSSDAPEVTARGVCWSKSQNPTLADSHTLDGSGYGLFVSEITGLTPNTTYYVRAYATNSVGTSYGDEVSFTTTNF